MGVIVKYKHGHKLVGECTAKSWFGELKVTRTQFADDIAIYCHMQNIFENTASKFLCTAAEWGLTCTVSVQKTKALIIGSHLAASDILLIQVNGSTIDIVSDFIYLGSNITPDGEIKNEVNLC